MWYKDFRPKHYFALLVALLLTWTGIYDYLFMQPRANKAQAVLQFEYESFQTLPGSIAGSTSGYKKYDAISRWTRYSVKKSKNEIREFCFKEADRLGWVIEKENRDSALFRKGEFQLEVGYDPERDDSYTIGFYWHGKRKSPFEMLGN